MHLNNAFSDINWWSVIVAAIAAFAIGSLWYSPVLFSKIWQKEVKLSDEDIKRSNLPMIFGASFVLQFIAAVVMDMYLGPYANLKAGIITGLFVSLGWIATSFGTTYLFSRRSLRLYLIDAGYYVLLFVVMGAILGAW